MHSKLLFTFWVGRIHWLPTQCYSWVGNCPPCPLGSRAFGRVSVCPSFADFRYRIETDGLIELVFLAWTLILGPILSYAVLRKFGHLQNRDASF